MLITVKKILFISPSNKKEGTPTIMGEIHVSTLPDEANNYADSVVIGEAERIWNTVLSDFESDKIKKRYAGGLVQPSDIPVLKGRDRLRDYFMPKILQTARGCPLDCEFCCVTKFNGGRFRPRSISDVLEAIYYLKEDVVIFADDNIVGYGKSAEMRARQLKENSRSRDSSFRRLYFRKKSFQITRENKIFNRFSIFVGI